MRSGGRIRRIGQAWSLYSDHGSYEGRVKVATGGEILISGADFDTVELRLYDSCGNLYGYGPALLDMSVESVPVKGTIRLRGNFRLAGPWTFP